MSDWLWDTWEYLAQGGWVMVPMAVASLAMWLMILERWRSFSRLGGRDLDGADALRVVGGAPLPESGRGLRRELIARFTAARVSDPRP